MRILIVDDEQLRQEDFRVRLHGYDLQHAFTYNEAVKALNGDRFNMVFLDHDLDQEGRQQTVDDVLGSETITGQHVAHYIARLPVEKRPDKVVVHSRNPKGRQAILDILKAAGVRADTQPFTG